MKIISSARFRLPLLAGMLITSLPLAGCMSPGGLTVGPVSGYLTSKNEDAVNRRSILLSQEIQPEQKQQLLKATNLGIRPGEFAVAAGIDLLAISETKLTWSEILQNVIGVVCDSAIYGGIGYAVSQTGSSGDSSPSYNMTFEGPVNNTSIVAGSPSANLEHSRQQTGVEKEKAGKK